MIALTPLVATHHLPPPELVGRASVRRWSLLLGFALVNLVGLALAAEAVWLGWVERLLAGDGTGTSHVILATFAAGLLLASREVVRLSRALDALASGAPQGPFDALRSADPARRGALESALKLELAMRVGHVRTIAGTLVLLGLIGTVLGFMLALAEVDPSTAGDVERIGPMVSGLVQGMGVALHTTLLGSILNVWLMADYRILEAAAVRLLAGVLRAGG